LYLNGLSGLNGLTVKDRPSSDMAPNYWLTCLLVDSDITGFNREDLRLILEAENIESRPFWKPMHLQPIFAEAPYFGNGISEHLFNMGLCLPSGSLLTDEEVYKVIATIRALF